MKLVLLSGKVVEIEVENEEELAQEILEEFEKSPEEVGRRLMNLILSLQGAALRVVRFSTGQLESPQLYHLMRTVPVVKEVHIGDLTFVIEREEEEGE